MRQNILIFILCNWILGSVSAQQKGTDPVQSTTVSPTGITRAVIAGISDYQNPNITDLQFADADAKEFAKYLKSNSGGNVDSTNIILLTNEKATAGQFVSALYWLLEETKQGDQAIIYFSGHGDVENTTMNQPGFLLCWDSPSKVYMGGGTFGLSYLQEIISTLSITKQAKVMVVTDACRAGKLAGSGVNGAQATAANLAKQYAGEVKIMSCQPDELALEGKSWGNGRGVFSYYFMAGIQGFADRNNDGLISLQEIERYLDDKVPAAVAPHSQIPLTVGSKSTIVAKYDINVLKTLKDPDLGIQISVTGGKGVDLSISEIKDSAILKKYFSFQQALQTGHFLYPELGSAYQLFQEIKDYPELANYAGLMRRNLAASLQDEAQQAINDYLKADPTEMKRRWNFDSRFKKFPDYLEKAAELMGEKHFYYKALLARFHYFKGLNIRLEGERLKSDSLLRMAVTEQEYCLKHEEKASFALNEIGFCYFLLNNFDAAIPYFNQTIAYNPNWVLPWVNLSASYLKKKMLGDALRCGNFAYQIDSTYPNCVYNLAICFEESGDNEKAIDWYKKVLLLDPDFNLSYYKLGRLYLKEGHLEESEKMMLEFLRRNPEDVDGLINAGHLYLKMNKPSEAEKYFVQAYHQSPENELAFQGIIEYYFITNKLSKANELLMEYISKNPTDSYAYYLIASIAIQSKDKSKCFQNLELAFKNGFKDLELIETDKSFKPILKKAAFKNLKKKYFN